MVDGDGGARFRFETKKLSEMSCVFKKGAADPKKMRSFYPPRPKF